jgi:transmembrane sensor
MPTSDQRIRSAIAEQAAEWFVTNRSGTASAEEQAAFGDWLKSSPLHIEEYLKTAAVSRDLHAAAASLNLDVDALLHAAGTQGDSSVIALRHRGVERPEVRNVSRRRPALLAGVAAAALLALCGGIWLQRDGQRFGLPRTFATAHGEQRSWLLPDGTRLDLNSDTTVTVRYNRSERLVQIDRGQALFHVAHENARRFRVAAGAIGIIAIGTEFDVFRKSGSTLVSVVEGRVAVFSGAAPRAAAPAALPAQAISVGAGEQARSDADAPPARLPEARVQQAVAWVQRQIAFERRPLGDVTEEFNRYSSVPIVIESDRLRALPISGVFRAYDTASFVSFISRLEGAQIERSATRIAVRDSLDATAAGPSVD